MYRKIEVTSPFLRLINIDTGDFYDICTILSAFGTLGILMHKLFSIFKLIQSFCCWNCVMIKILWWISLFFLVLLDIYVYQINIFLVNCKSEIDYKYFDILGLSQAIAFFDLANSFYSLLQTIFLELCFYHLDKKH